MKNIRNRTVSEVIQFLSGFPPDAFVWGWDDESICVGTRETQLGMLKPIEEELNNAE